MLQLSQNLDASGSVGAEAALFPSKAQSEQFGRYFRDSVLFHLEHFKMVAGLLGTVGIGSLGTVLSFSLSCPVHDAGKCFLMPFLPYLTPTQCSSTPVG